MALNTNIAAFIKHFKEQHHLTYDQIADAARQYGVGWSSATMQSMEHGARMADSLSNMLILASALNDLLEKAGWPRSLTLSDLIQPDDDTDGLFYNLGKAQDRAAASVDSVMEAMSGEPVTITSKIFDHDARHEQGISQPIGEPRFAYRSDDEGSIYLCDFDVVSDHMPTIAEKRAAERLNMTPYNVAAFCAVRYGHTLEEESYKRAGLDSTPQKRGRATRTIIDEVRETLEDLERQAREHGTAELKALS